MALRTLLNLEQDYDHWVETMRALDHRLIWKTRTTSSSERDYLYRIQGKIEHSLGPRNNNTEEQMTTYQTILARRTSLINRLRMTSALCRTQKIICLDKLTGSVFRTLDVAGEVGIAGVMVVGTHALAVYEQAAQTIVDSDMTATMDLDLAWMRQNPYSKRPVIDTLKSQDSTWTINSERPFQMLNSKGEEIELLVAPSLEANFPRTGLQPVNMPEQEWLLKGNPITQVLPTIDRHAAKLVAPDPRYFALHKIFISRNSKRNVMKRPKDAQQGEAIINLILEHLPDYPMDEAFINGLPLELQNIATETLKNYFNKEINLNTIFIYDLKHTEARTTVNQR